MNIIDYIRENGFIDKKMAQVTMKVNNEIDDLLFGKISVAINVDKKRIKKWADMCSELEHIDYNIIKDVALKRKYQEMENKIQDLKFENDMLKSKIEDMENGYGE